MSTAQRQINAQNTGFFDEIEKCVRQVIDNSQRFRLCEFASRSRERMLEKFLIFLKVAYLAVDNLAEQRF